MKQIKLVVALLFVFPIDNRYAYILIHFKGLTDLVNSAKFYTYYRMSTEQFDNILAQIEHLIYKPNSKWWHSISPEEKLAICIRYKNLYY